MPFTFLLVFVVAILGTLSLKLKNRWQANQALTADASPAQPLPRQPLRLARLTQEVSTWRNRLPFASKRPDLSARFRAWAADTFAQDEALSGWLLALSPGAHKAFTQQVAEFCDEMGFALAALVDGQLAEIPATAQQATTIVLQYCRANQQAALAQDDFDAAKRFLAYLRAPTQKASLEFGQKLYSRLVEEKMIPPPSFDMMMATEETRRANSLAAIHHAAAQNPTAFNTILKAVTLDGLAQPSGIPPVEPVVAEAVIPPVASEPIPTATEASDTPPTLSQAATATPSPEEEAG